MYQLWNCDHDADRVVAACKRTLAALRLEYLDLYLVHWPMAFKAGKELMPRNADGTVAYSNVHYTTTWPKMEECVTSGLAKSIGLSNFNSKQVDEILGIAKIRPVINQVQNQQLSFIFRFNFFELHRLSCILISPK
jgi:diketogulonate reductase-like aldo/keto reductase